jgi:HK97 family phage major capsid protein
MLDTADAAERGLTAEEEGQYTDLEARIDGLAQAIERRERVEGWQTEMGQPARPGMRPDPTIGMTPAEQRDYSLVRALNAAVRGDWRGAELEQEASAATAQRLGREPQGFYVPFDYLAGNGGRRSVQVRTNRGFQYVREQRDLTVGTDTAGGHTVATDLMSTDFIDLLRNAMMVQRAGARMLTGLVGDVAIPRQTGGATAYWVAESGAPTESQAAFDQVTLAPKTIGAYSDISRKLLRQASIDIEAIVRQDLATVLALEIDRAALHGSGSSNQPTGVAATSGIGSVAGGTNGLAPAHSHIVALETEVAQDNADMGRVAYMTNTKVRGKLKSTVVGTDQRMLWAEGGTPLNGYPAWITNQVANNLTKGTSNGVCSAIFFGNWGDLLIGMWGALDVLVDPYSSSTTGTVRVVALQDVDIAVRHPQSFAAMLDALTA